MSSGARAFRLGRIAPNHAGAARVSGPIYLCSVSYQIPDRVSCLALCFNTAAISFRDGHSKPDGLDHPEGTSLLFLLSGTFAATSLAGERV